MREWPISKKIGGEHKKKEKGETWDSHRARGDHCQRRQVSKGKGKIHTAYGKGDEPKGGARAVLVAEIHQRQPEKRRKGEKDSAIKKSTGPPLTTKLKETPT